MNSGLGTTIKPRREFIETIEREIAHVEISTYDMIKNISRQTSQTIDNVFGLIRYTNFLSSYNGLPQETSLRIARNKFRAGQ